LTTTLVDSFRAAGQGMGYTYPADGFGPLPPLMRLDYIFHSSHFQSLSARTLPSQGLSDHLPLMATLALVNASEVSHETRGLSSPVFVIQRWASELANHDIRVQ
jgi:hypothetical protein